MNVLLIISDDFGWADVTVNNPGSFYDTPALDRLAREGASFARAYATNPVCSPSRVSLMTGRYPTWTDTTTWFWTKPHRNENFRTAASVNQLPLDEVTIGQVLSEGGHRSLYVGKWHLGHERDRWPDRRGFDESYAASGVGGPGREGYFAPFQEGIPDVDAAPAGAHLPELLTDRAIEFIGRDDDRPFFVTLSYYSVHTPIDGRADLIAKYEPRAAALGYTEDERYGQEEQVWDRLRASSPTRAVRQRQDNAVYAAMIEAMDAQIGRVLDTLDEHGLADSTLVVFTSDHGGLALAEGSPTSNLPLRGGKGWIYEGGLRVPLLVRWPGVTRPGSVVRTAAIGNDLFPTMVEAAGLDVAAHGALVDGVSLRPAMRSPEPLAREPFFWHYPHYSNQGGFPAAAAMLGGWKLIQRLEDGRVHLYNIDADPGEQRDVGEEHPAIRDDLLGRLHAWQARSGVEFLRPKGATGREPWKPAYARP